MSTIRDKIERAKASDRRVYADADARPSCFSHLPLEAQSAIAAVPMAGVWETDVGVFFDVNRAAQQVLVTKITPAPTVGDPTTFCVSCRGLGDAA